MCGAPWAQQCKDLEATIDLQKKQIIMDTQRFSEMEALGLERQATIDRLEAEVARLKGEKVGEGRKK
jgi:hypothetical protein